MTRAIIVAKNTETSLSYLMLDVWVDGALQQTQINSTWIQLIELFVVGIIDQISIIVEGATGNNIIEVMCLVVQSGNITILVVMKVA